LAERSHDFLGRPGEAGHLPEDIRLVADDFGSVDQGDRLTWRHRAHASKPMRLMGPVVAVMVLAFCGTAPARGPRGRAAVLARHTDIPHWHLSDGKKIGHRWAYRFTGSGAWPDGFAYTCTGTILVYRGAHWRDDWSCSFYTTF
jgi:hypothetical protein